MPKPKQKSRAKRWEEAVGNAMSALEELCDLQMEYQEWLDNLPENLQSSPVGEKLEAVCGIDLDGAKGSVEEAEGADLPMGFGRD